MQHLNRMFADLLGNTAFYWIYYAVGLTYTVFTNSPNSLPPILYLNRVNTYLQEYLKFKI